MFVSATPFSTPLLQPFITETYSLGNNKFLPAVTRFSYVGTNLNTDCRKIKEDVAFRIKKLMLPVQQENVCLQTQMYLLSQNELFMRDLLFLLYRILVPYPKIIFYVTYFPPSLCNLRISNKELLRHLNLRTIDDYVTKIKLCWLKWILKD